MARPFALPKPALNAVAGVLNAATLGANAEISAYNPAPPIRRRGERQDLIGCSGSRAFLGEFTSARKGACWLRGGGSRLQEAFWKLPVASDAWSDSISTP